MDFSKLAQQIKTSPTLAISAKAKELKSEGRDVIGFGAGEPDFDTPQFIKEAAIEAINRGETKYTPASGLAALKDSVCRKLKRNNGLSYSRDEIIISCGAKHSLFNLIMCLSGEGDEVIIPAPYWVSYPEMVRAAGATPVEVKSSRDFKITPEILSKKINSRTKALILNSPSNPTGSVYTEKELKGLAEIIIKSGITVISDEIYEHLTYNCKFISIAALSKEIKKQAVIVNGVSKAYAMTGWRIGYAAGPKDIISACGRLQSHSTSNPSTISQYAAIKALDSSRSPEAVKQMLNEFKKRRNYMYSQLCSIKGLNVNRPDGAFYIFPDISNFLGGKITSSSDFAQKLLKEKLVAVVPGEGFGAPSFIRLSYATSMENITKGLDRIKEFLKEV